ncbi:MAG: radical SAM protein [Polyangiaceae bacterium]
MTVENRVRRLPMVAQGVDSNFADFQNDALLATREGDPSAKVESHESAAHEKRNWVRLSYDCNNRCTFCLDSNAHDGTMRDNDEIKVQIIQGRKRGSERLILSGGEPTMHPNFLDFVLLGKRAGYRKIQTVTNGRMFRYPAFLERARDNGLDEITFSLHGHTAKLHDALVGTPGAFEEEVAGLKAALASGAFIVNVDIVINKRNVKHLAEMLEIFIGWGVKEFDLLHVIPFGNAWTEAREHLFYDLDGNLEHLQRAFAFARRPDVHVWLNRFPPPYAEGFEDLIQDPYKLNDEVRGRREEFDRYIALGKKLDCREPERCNRCYLKDLCDSVEAVIDTSRAAEVDVLRLEASAPWAELARTGAAPALPRAPVARLVATDLAAASRLASVLPASVTALELELEDYAGFDGAPIAGRKIERCYAPSSAALTALVNSAAEVRINAALTRDTAPLVTELASDPRLEVHQPNYDRMTDARANDVELAAFTRALPASVALENVPACLSGRAPLPERRALDVAMLGSDGRVHMPAFTQRYIDDGFYTKALRCKDCRENDACRGVHVNWVRAHGFSALQPIAREG